MMKRQGDLLIVPISTIPGEAVHQQSRVLAEGELTGHRHELTAGDVFYFQNEIFFTIPPEAPSVLTHPEHKPIEFFPGKYKVIRQKEYEPEKWRYVRD